MNVVKVTLRIWIFLLPVSRHKYPPDSVFTVQPYRSCRMSDPRSVGHQEHIYLIIFRGSGVQQQRVSSGLFYTPSLFEIMRLPVDIFRVLSHESLKCLFYVVSGPFA